ncbi:MAG TPA: methyltransferase domain-containing protein [Burkholderiales bacterium]|nr:methyltransferase domain-containing protein [Burkholderiales bacterium]
MTFLRPAGLALALGLSIPATAQTPDVPFVATPPVVVDAMLKLAGVGAGDYVIDLGSGDGRIVIAAAKQHGARGLGVEIDTALVGAARLEARRQGVEKRVEFKADDLLGMDISRATVVTMYLYPRLMLAMRPRLIAELKPGARIVSHEFGMEGWEPDARVTVPVPDKPYGAPSSDVLLWIVPADARGVWRWRLVIGGTTVDHELALSQDFQKLRGGPGFEAGTMKGDEIRFVLVSNEGGGVLRREYRGRIDGDSIRGIVRLAGGEELPWQAARTRSGRIQ